jgi:hypothetical protein
MKGLVISILIGLVLFTIGWAVIDPLPKGSSWGYALFYWLGITHIFVYLKFTDKWLW